MRSKYRIVPVVLAIALGALSIQAGGISVVRVASGLEQPVYVTAPPEDTSRLFIVEANSGGSTGGPLIARIKILNLSGPSAGTINATPFLTINGVLQIEDQGLFGLVFHPNYAENGFFYVNYALGAGGGESRIERYQVSAGDPDVADPTSAKLILKFFKPYYNHNGDWLGFSPVDLLNGNYNLYHTTGDGGSNLDPQQLAQDLTKRNGKLLRVDVGPDGTADTFPDNDNYYAIPPDNPFIGTPGADPAIWGVGLRNPWRASFDRETGDLYIGNVGANLSDEVELQPYDSPGGDNYGWSRLEGTGTGPNPGPSTPQDVFPMFECIHGGSLTECPKRSLTGGYVYRGPILELRGHYIFADFLGTYNFGNQTGKAQIFSIRYDGTDPTSFDGTNIADDEIINRTAEFTPDAGSIDFVSSFGEDAEGNLYIVDMGNLGTPDGNGLGEIFKITGTAEGRVVGLLFAADGQTLNWDPTSGASGYDLVKGDLDGLRSSGGDFTTALVGCLEDDGLAPQASDADDPGLGQGFFYVARAVNGSGIGGTYDGTGTKQVASRNLRIRLSPQRCP